MNTPVIAVIVVVALIVGSALSIMKKACKRGYHSWCAPMSTVHHHIRIQAPCLIGARHAESAVIL
jgi:hypothetical protein